MLLAEVLFVSARLNASALCGALCGSREGLRLTEDADDELVDTGNDNEDAVEVKLFG